MKFEDINIGAEYTATRIGPTMSNSCRVVVIKKYSFNRIAVRCVEHDNYHKKHGELFTVDYKFLENE